jgi:hypothetical protein
MSAAPSTTLRRARRGWRRLVAEKLPYLVLAAADLIVVWIAVQREAKISGLVAHGDAGRVAMAFYSFFYYPWKLVGPVELSPLYEVPAHLDPFGPRFVVALFVVVLATAALVAFRKRSRCSPAARRRGMGSRRSRPGDRPTG